MAIDLTPTLSHVYWIGGSPCAGKSSIADMLGAHYGLRVYHVDDAFDDHVARATPQRQPTFCHLNNMPCDELWMRPVAEQVQTAIAYCREEFDLIVADLRALPPSPPVVAEGMPLLPRLTAPLLAEPNHAIWIVPTAEFQFHHYAQRSWVANVLADCRDSQAAFRNWMARDAAFATWIRTQTHEQRLHHLLVDGAQTIAENMLTVARHFGFTT